MKDPVENKVKDPVENRVKDPVENSVKDPIEKRKKMLVIISFKWLDIPCKKCRHILIQQDQSYSINSVILNVCTTVYNFIFINFFIFSAATRIEPLSDTFFSFSWIIQLLYICILGQSCFFYVRTSMYMAKNPPRCYFL